MDLTRRAGVIGIEVAVNFVIPYVIYIGAVAHIGEVHALLTASLPPILWSGIEFARNRRVDAMSILVLAGIVLSLLAFVGGGSVRFLQLRENLVTGLISLVFLGSAAIGKPLIYQLARAGQLRKSQSGAQELARLRASNPHFRRSMTVMTLVWGFGLLVETVVACALVFHMSIPHYLILSPILGYGAMGGLALWTYWYVQRMKRRGKVARERLNAA